MADKLTLDRGAMKDPSTSHLRIYVGGVNTDQPTSVDELYDHFIPYGQVNGIVVNRGFGFVQFEDEASAQEAINKANGSVLNGKMIQVRTAQQNQQKREVEVVTIKPDIPPAVALGDNNFPAVDDGDTEYDSYGNYIGDRMAHEEYEEHGGRGGGGRGARGAPRGRGGRGRAPRGRVGAQPFRERSPLPRGGEWGAERYERYGAPEYPRALPVPERNDCEIIVVAKSLTEYAEYIEGRLKRLGIVVDLLFPMEDVPIGKVLGNVASRGCLYAILVMPQNQVRRSLTLTILHGLPQEHRNMPLEDALQLLSRNFAEVQRGGPGGREAVYALLGQLADGRTLTALQYDKVIEYLQERKQQQVKIELGEPLAPAASRTQTELQQRILSILNDKQKEAVKPVPAPAPAPVAVPAPAPASKQSELLSDPTVRKALDSILHKFV